MCLFFVENSTDASVSRENSALGMDMLHEAEKRRLRMTNPSTSADCGGLDCATKADYRSHASEGRKRNARPVTSRAVSHGCRRFVRTQQEGRESEAFQQIFLASRQKFVRMAYSILRNKEDAEDAVQNASLSAYRHLRAFEGRSALTTWFTRIVLNAALMIKRKQKSLRIGSVPESSSDHENDWTENTPAPQPDPEMVYAKQETCELIDAELRKMAPVLRQAFTMTYYDEMSNREACALLGVPMSTFKARLFRARQSLVRHTSQRLATPARKKTLLVPSSAKSDLQPLAQRTGDVSTLEVAFS
jgi:RNA polymerase sigma-70 factor, ECF subfamily